MRTIAARVLVVLFLSGCSNQSQSPHSDPADSDVPKSSVVQPEPGDSKTQVPSDLKPIIDRLGSGGPKILQTEERKTLRTWLTKTVVKGGTTKDEVIAIFGKQFRDLDRPKRDSIISIQYAVGGHGNQTRLQFDLDPKTNIVTDWSLGHAICGLCPHVFVNDKRWHLEGKMLAGCVGLAEEGRDVLLLPRLQAHDGRFDVKLSNLAAELDYIDSVELGIVGLDEGEELDVGVGGTLFAWRQESERDERMELGSTGRGELSLKLRPSQEDRVVVLEIRNTTEFETAMREFVTGKSPTRPEATMQAEFDGELGFQIPPVGTKFYRRVVLPIPQGTRLFHLEATHELWIVRRAWVGTGRLANTDVRWQPPADASGPTNGTVAILNQRDGQRLCLKPMQEAQLQFDLPEPKRGVRRSGYVLRMSGYCDFEWKPDSR